MGLLSSLFGKGKSAARLEGSSSTSLAGTLAQQKALLSPERCDACGATYLSSESRVCIISVRSPDFVLDVGGYCPGCRKAYCGRHLRFDHVAARHLPDPGKVRNTSYGLVCQSCGTQVRHDRIAEPTKHITIIALEAKNLEPERLTPSPEFAAPSGKFSLYKIFLSGLPEDADPLLSLLCTRCRALHPNPMPAPMFGLAAFRNSGLDFGPQDFEVDIGGVCPVCGIICGKHIVARIVTEDGNECLALYCAEHGKRLE